MFDFWLHLRTYETQDEAEDPLLHRRSGTGLPDRPFYDVESGELDPEVLAEAYAEGGDVNGLIRMLAYPHDAVTEAAVRGLVSLSRQGIPFLIQAAFNRSLPAVVPLRIAYGFDQMGTAPALRGLALLLTHPQKSVQRRALFALVRHGERSVGPLLPILRSGDPEVRLRVAAALVEIGHPQGLSTLQQIAQRTPVRRPRIEPALSQDVSGLEPMLGGITPETLRLLINDETRSIEERRMAIFRYVELTGEGAGLADLLNGETPVPLRQAAALALAYLGEDISGAGGLAHRDVALNTLLIALLHPVPAIRRGAAYGLGLSKEERTVPHIAPLLTDPDAHVRRAAAVALLHIGTADAHHLLREHGYLRKNRND